MLFWGMYIGTAIREKMENPQKTKTRISHKLAISLLGIYPRYADDSILMAENEEEVNNLLMRVKEESEKTGLKLNIQKIKIVASSPITSGHIKGDKVKAVTDVIFLGSKITVDSDCSHGIKAMINLDSISKTRDTLCQQRTV